MTEIIPLELRYDKDGPALKSDEPIFVGDYEITEGQTKIFYMSNLNKGIIANVSDLKTANDNSTFHGPESGFIGPEQTVEVSIHIHADNPLEKIGAEESKINELPADDDKLVGTIRWENARS